MAINDENNVFRGSALIEDDKPGVKLIANYFVSKDSTNPQEGVQTTEQLLVLEIHVLKLQQGQCVIHAKILEKDTTLKANILDTAVFKMADSDKSKPPYERLSDKPTVDETSRNSARLHMKPLEMGRLCLAILFRGSISPTFELSFSMSGKHKGVKMTHSPFQQYFAPSRPTSDQTPFSWALKQCWFDAFVRSDNENVLCWAALNGNLELVEHLKAHSKDRFESLLDHPDKDGRTPLSLAAGARKDDIARFLLDEGADVHSEDNQNMTPMSWTASLVDSTGDHDLLLQMIRCAENSDNQPSSWKLKHLHQAARFGWRYAAVMFHVFLGIDVDTLLPSQTPQSPNEAIYDEETALCMAAEHGHTNVVRTLLRCGADVNFSTAVSRYTPLMFAIKGEVNEYVKAAVVDALMDGGAVISQKNARGDTVEDMAIRKGLQSILTRLTWRSKDGPAAESVDQLDQAVDSYFSATVTTFETETDSLKRFVPQKHRVSELLRNPADKVKKPKEIKQVTFQWIHLPANNMRWIEVLISQLYKDKTQTYNILKPERWVLRQHHRGLSTSDATLGDSGVHHARFMTPMCQAFRSSRDQVPSTSKSLNKLKDDSDTNLVLFVSTSFCKSGVFLSGVKLIIQRMPYLHWDITEQQTKRMEVMNQTARRVITGDEWGFDQMLLDAYLFYQNDSQTHSNSEEPSPKQHYMHQLHVRRTLDQYYYHDLDSTKERDHDQVLSRAACQKHLAPESKVLAMVDQLWLWVLAGKDGQPTTIVSCFPDREPKSNNRSRARSSKPVNDYVDPDVSGDTNILKEVLSHLLDNPQSVQTPYDLARLITLKCSRTYLDIGGQDERLRFKEMYKMAIGDVVQQETELFDEFNVIMEAVTKEKKMKQTLRTQLRSLSKMENSDKNQSQTIKQLQAGFAARFEALFQELNDDSPNEFVISLVNSSRGKITKEKVQELLKMAQFRVLDITKELQLLHEIKDVQDELRIMSMIFRDQKVIVDEMEDIMRSIPLKGTQAGPSASHSRKPEEQMETELSEEGETTDRARERVPDQKAHGDNDETGKFSPQERNTVHVGNNAFFNIVKGANFAPMPGPTDYHIENNAFFESRAPEPGTTLDEKERYVLSPRAIVQLSMSEIEHMIDGASNAFNALNLLIDLKQKQSNVIDARYARMQAEESVKQGKTIMVFTIVTIVFLPLSFMAAFFAIDISQFKRVKDGKLSLGYVSEIMFPISAAIIASLIYIAFRIDSFEQLWTTKLLAWWKRKKLKDLENS